MKFIESLVELDKITNSLFRLDYSNNYLAIVSIKKQNIVHKINFENFNELEDYGFYDYKLLSGKFNASTLECELDIVPLYVNREWKYGKKISETEIVIIGNLKNKLKEHGFRFDSIFH